MPTHNLQDTNHLRSHQYKDSSNLDARTYLHDRFSTNKIGLQRWIFDQLLQEDVQHILDLGCGPGYLWAQNSRRIPEHWALSFADISWGMLNVAREKGALIQNPLRFVVSDAQALPFPKDSFDLIIANHMLYHVPELEVAFAEIQRVLRSAGRLYCTTNSAKHMKQLFAWLSSSGFDPFRWKADGETNLPFSIENGTQQLEKWFSKVEKRIYKDALKVTEVEPLINYALSMFGVQEAVDRDPERLKHLRSSAQTELDARGFIHISKDPGLFIARK